MSAPTTATVLAAASLAMGAAGTAMSAMGSARQAQAQAQSNAANYQAQVARNNQKVADWKAKDDLARGQVSEDQRRMKTSLQVASQRAAMASSGGDINSESAIDLVATRQGRASSTR